MAPTNPTPPSKPAGQPAGQTSESPSFLALMTKLLETNEQNAAKLAALVDEMAEIRSQVEGADDDADGGDGDGDELDGSELENPQVAAPAAPETKPVEQRVELGCKVRDRLSGYVGIATVKCIHLNGCVRFYVQKEGLDEKGRPRACEVFDVNQLEVLAGPGAWVTPGTPAGGIGGPFDDEIIAQIAIDVDSRGVDLGTRAIHNLRRLGVELEDADTADA